MPLWTCIHSRQAFAARKLLLLACPFLCWGPCRGKSTGEHQSAVFNISRDHQLSYDTSKLDNQVAAGMPKAPFKQCGFAALNRPHSQPTHVRSFHALCTYCLLALATDSACLKETYGRFHQNTSTDAELLSKGPTDVTNCCSLLLMGLTAGQAGTQVC